MNERNSFQGKESQKWRMDRRESHRFGDSGYCYIVPPYKQASTLPIGFLITDVIEDEKKIKDAINLVRTFTKYPDRTASTNSFIESLKLLADTVESQMEEVK